MKVNKCFAIFLIITLQFIVLFLFFSILIRIFPIKVQDTFQRSFIHQKQILINLDHKILNSLNNKLHHSDSDSFTSQKDYHYHISTNDDSEIKGNNDDDEANDTYENFDYNAIITEIPTHRSSQVHGLILIIFQIIRTLYGVFYSCFYAIKSIFKIFFSSVGSTIKYALYRSQGVNIVLTKFVSTTIIIPVKIFRLLTYGIRYIGKIIRVIFYKFFLHDDVPSF